MARQVTRLEVTHKMGPDVSPKDVSETVALNLFDIDPYAESESPLNIDLDLDQIEDSDEE